MTVFISVTTVFQEVDANLPFVELSEFKRSASVPQSSINLLIREYWLSGLPRYPSTLSLASAFTVAVWLIILSSSFKWSSLLAMNVSNSGSNRPSRVWSATTFSWTGVNSLAYTNCCNEKIIKSKNFMKCDISVEVCSHLIFKKATSGGKFLNKM